MMKMRAYSGLVYQAKINPDTPAIIDDFSAYTYSQMLSDVYCLKSALESAGITGQDRIAVISTNRYEVMLLVLCGLLGGPVVVPVNRRVAIDEMEWIVDNAAAKAIFVDSELENEISLCGRDVFQNTPVRVFSGLNANNASNDFLSWLRDFPDAAIDAEYLPSRPYLQVYTSGTSGRPKGVVLSEENCLGQLTSLLLSIDLSLAQGDSIYEGLPLFHVGGIFISLLALNIGLTLRYAQKFCPVGFESMVLAGDVQHAALVPAMLQACVSLPKNDKDSFRIKSILYGASPINSSTLTHSKDRYGCDFLQVYGMTETHSLISVMSAADHRYLFDTNKIAGSAGRAIPGSVLEIVDADGNVLPCGKAGEIRVSSQNVMCGYWQNEEATRDTLRDGFLYTGDVGYLNEEGFLFIIDRLKDIIISGGENVSSLEVESVLLGHPKVVDVAVVATPDVRWGEVVTAVVVSNDDSFSTTELIEYAKPLLGGFKTPKIVHVVDTIPRNANGKILKKVLREQFSTIGNM
ncbi:AMP-binding protein [uncultured Zhongshania sp.]|uniref:AMP-binding protein n=1 Tax=uncultured Zhongshania sp. TaxID=1642288 RepID=UPI0025EDF68F|nr:AMP-binding protein [uncultured Zhongshania sp.]